MISKNILQPGDGINIPQNGDYVKLDLQIYSVDINSNKKMFFNSNNIPQMSVDIRYGTPECSLVKELEELIGEMSLFEKCSVEIKFDNKIKESGFTPYILDLLKTYKNLVFELQICDISKFPHY